MSRASRMNQRSDSPVYHRAISLIVSARSILFIAARSAILRHALLWAIASLGQHYIKYTAQHTISNAYPKSELSPPTFFLIHRSLQDDWLHNWLHGAKKKRSGISTDRFLMLYTLAPRPGLEPGTY